MNYRKGFIAPLILALIAILILGGGTYVYLQKNQENPPVTGNVALPLATSTTQTSNSQIASWKMYKNDKRHFSFSYPQNWSLTDSGESASLILKNESGKEAVYITSHLRNLVSDFDNTLEKDIKHSVSDQPGTQKIENVLLEKIFDTDQTLGYLSQWNIFATMLQEATKTHIETRYDVESKLEQPSVSSTGKYKSVFSVVARQDFNDLNLFKLIISTFEFAPAKTQTSNSQTNTSISISVPGMSKYTDTDFGFSFWYPSSWTIQSTATRDSYGGGTVQKTLTIVPPSDPNRFNGSNITIDEFYSPTKEIATPADQCSAMHANVIPAKRYYFDSSTHAWMVETSATTEYSEKDGSQYTLPAKIQAADVTNNTMGGLHTLSTGCSGKVIPLSAHNFLVFGYNRLVSPYYYDDLAKTITATDPSVAAPVSSDEQKQTIVAEGLQFGGLGTHIGNSWYRYNAAIYDYNGTLIPNADAISFKAVTGGFAVDSNYVYDGRKGIVKDADPQTFQTVLGPDGTPTGFEKDKSHVWHESTLIPGADPTTFAIVINTKQPSNTFFQKDATHVWRYNGKVVIGADPASFSILNQSLWQSALFETDAHHVWFDGLLIPEADPKTFVVDAYNTSNWTALMHDANHSYELLNTLDAISSTTVKIDGGTPVPLQ